MLARLEIDDTDSGLRIQVTDSWDISRIAMNLAGCIIYVLFLLYVFPSHPISIAFWVILAIAVVGEIFTALRGTNVTLKVDNLDLMSTGHAPGGYRPSLIPRAEIYKLEYRPASGGGDEPEYPEGVHVGWKWEMPWNAHDCILPGIDKAQSEEVIAAILRRFPDTGTLPPSVSYKSDLTTLNLN